MKTSYSGNILCPLPVALVGAEVEGRPNYLVIGYISPFDFGRQVFFSLFKQRHTAKGILHHRTFSVNIPSAGLVDRVRLVGSMSGRELDKSALFESFYGELETAPMIAECPLNMECEVTQIVDTELNHGVIGRVVQSYVDEDLLKDEKTIDLAKADPLVWTTGGDRAYHTLGDRIRM